MKVTRRDVAVGVAWAMPAVAAVHSVPAFAASPEPAMQGLVNQRTHVEPGYVYNFKNGSTYESGYQLIVDQIALGAEPYYDPETGELVSQYGLYVDNSPTQPTSATITIYLPADYGVVTAPDGGAYLQNLYPESGWSNLVPQGGPRSVTTDNGVTLTDVIAYTTTFSGTWVLLEGRWYAGVIAPYWAAETVTGITRDSKYYTGVFEDPQAMTRTTYVGALYWAVHREVVVGGEAYTIFRGQDRAQSETTVPMA